MSSIKRLIKKLYIKFKLATTKLPAVVLMLHSINAKENEKTEVNISRNKFIDLLDTIEKFEHLDAVVGVTGSGIALTFDDGRSDIYDEVYPLLKERQIPFTIFVTYNLLDEKGYLTKEQLLELAEDELVTIGSHCMNHAVLAKHIADMQYGELVGSKKALEELLHRPVEHLAYPFGQYNQDTIKVIKENDAYKYAYVAGGCFVSKNNAFRYRLDRMNISNLYYAENIKLLKSVKQKLHYICV